MLSTPGFQPARHWPTFVATLVGTAAFACWGSLSAQASEPEEPTVRAAPMVRVAEVPAQFRQQAATTRTFASTTTTTTSTPRLAPVARSVAINAGKTMPGAKPASSVTRPTPTLTHAPGTTISYKASQQVIVATASAAGNTIAWFEWSPTQRRWETKGAAGAAFGYNGVRDGSLRGEGDGTTPLGSYPILLEFGTTRRTSEMPFRLVTNCSYWISDGALPDYNRWRESCSTPRSRNVHLMDYVTNSAGQYRDAALIGFNYDNPIRPPAQGSGSGVMLHYTPPGGHTTGCVGVTNRDAVISMLAWMRWIASPFIVIRRV